MVKLIRTLLFTLTLFALFIPLQANAQEEKKGSETTAKDEKAADPYTSPITKPVKDDKGVLQVKIDKGDTAWMLVSTGLVMLMVPGLALFYGGLVRRKNVLGTMMHSMVALGIIGVQWVIYGYALAFGKSNGGWIGWSEDMVGLQGVLSNDTFATTGLSVFVHCMYQGMFAIITPALISGAIAERVRFGPYCLFILLWATLVYDPLAHWVWALNAKGESVGFLGAMGAIDFAGGTVVHVAAGVSGLAAILALRKRTGYPEHAITPNSVVLSLVGAGLLWFGWFGFNGGSALASNAQAGAALTATQVAAASAALVWVLVEWLHRKKPTGLGLATGLVAGLVAITPASGFVSPVGALVIGALAGVVCYIAVVIKPWLKYDDSLDAFGVHGVGGALGAVLTGVFASVAIYSASTGLSYFVEPGKPDTTFALATLGEKGADRAALITVQVKAVAIAAGYSFAVSFVLVKIIDLLFGFCSSAKNETLGLDRAEHGEVGFDFGPPSLEEMVDGHGQPRPATAPPEAKKRFTVVVDGAEEGELLKIWSDLCQTSQAPPPEMKAIYPHFSTVQGNRFRFQDGEPSSVSNQLERLFESRLRGKKVRVRVET